MDSCPKLLDLMSRRNWHVKREEEEEEEEAIDEKSLELSLGPPGDDNSTKINHAMFDDKSQASFANFSKMTYMPSNTKTSPPNSPQFYPPSLFLAFTQKESSQPCCTKVDLQQQSAEKKTFSANNTAVHSSAQKRTAPSPVVGWPPVRSFRKNLASSSLKPSSEVPNVVNNKAVAAGENPGANNQKGLFVKINMDGVPIGRKVDLKAHDSYEKLSSVVDQLFTGLLAAQSDSSANGVQEKKEGKMMISGLLDGSGEYTLVYEDQEGDRMLVGDVPWHMFVSTVKRLRVLKTSELPTLSRGAKQGKLTIGS